MTTEKHISPLGESATNAAARRYASSPAYRAQHDKLAPYRVIAHAVILGRADTGLTQEELGAAIGTTGSAVSRIESGTRPIKLETLSKLGTALGITFAVGAPDGAGRNRVVVPAAAMEATLPPRTSGLARRPA